MASQNSVGVNNSTIPPVPTIPPPQQPEISPVQQDQEQVQTELTSTTEETITPLVTGSIIEEETEGVIYVLDSDEEFVEESFTEELINIVEDESQYQDFSAPPNTIVDKDIEKYPSLGPPFADNKMIKRIKCRLVDGKPVKEELIIPFINMKEACLNETRIPLLITSGYRPAYENIIYKNKKIAQSQRELREQNVINKGKYKEVWKYTTTVISTGKQITLTSGYFKPETAAAGSSNHGNGDALDFNTGTRRALSGFGPLNEILYTWLINNSWKYGFVRTVSNEEWHWEYLPTLSGKTPTNPYVVLKKSNDNRFYSDLNIV